ncbi:unnamed protein product [Phytophthora fragariaefolia]|uniref:Unnamed protein product n=1 Tax=Phytophthora fragariaefolia TaxID=1490495 RepID=A0A9W6XCS9_9STRA|nr:unnamed protein product [Phytophthora fragariaefolia]
MSSNEELNALPVYQQQIRGYSLLVLGSPRKSPYPEHSARASTKSFNNIHMSVSGNTSAVASQFDTGNAVLGTGI